VLQIVVQIFLSKLVFLRHPHITAIQLMFIRSCFSLIIFGLILNRNFVKVVFGQNIPRGQLPLLAVRVLLSILTLTCVYVCAKVFPVVYVGLFQNVVPLSTAALSYFYLKKGLSKL
jgi:hypothetical protein